MCRASWRTTWSRTTLLIVLPFLPRLATCQILESSSSSFLHRNLSPESSIIDELAFQLASGTQHPRLTLTARPNFKPSTTTAEFITEFDMDVVMAQPSVTSSTLISSASRSFRANSSVRYLISDQEGFAILAVDGGSRSVQGIIQKEGTLVKFEQLNDTESVVEEVQYDIPKDWTCGAKHYSRGGHPETLDSIRRHRSPTHRHLYATDSFPQSYTYQVDLYIEIDEALVIYHDPGNAEDMPNTIEYVNALVTAASSVYEREIDTHLHVLHISVSTQYDSAVGTDAALEIMLEQYGNPDRWHYRDPVSGASPDVHHAILYKDLGGGIAYVGAVCHPNYGYGVTTGMRGTMSNIMDGAMFWDFAAFAHEMGHNFGSHHTHDPAGYDPLVDACGNEQCTSLVDGSRVSAGDATIMSYCHLCGNGVSNFAASFGGYWYQDDRSDIDNWKDNEGVVPFSQVPKRVPKTMYEHIKSLGSCVQPNIPVVNKTCKQNDDCFDGNSCTVDVCNTLMQQCSNDMQFGCCGNFICEAEELDCRDCGPFTVGTPSCSSCTVPYGVMFDVEATKDIVLTSLTFRLYQGNNRIIVYTAPGGYSDKASDASAWTRIHSRKYSVSDWSFVTVDFEDIAIRVGSIQAFYIHSSNRLTTIDGNIDDPLARDEHIRLLNPSRGVVDKLFGDGDNGIFSWVGSMSYSLQVPNPTPSVPPTTEPTQSTTDNTGIDTPTSSPSKSPDKRIQPTVKPTKRNTKRPNRKTNKPSSGKVGKTLNPANRQTRSPSTKPAQSKTEKPARKRSKPPIKKSREHLSPSVATSII